MTPRLPSLLLFTCLAVSSGCTSIISSSTSEPLTEDPGSRSLGSYIDDEIIETKVMVNIRNGVNSEHSTGISAHSHNGIVLLLGQLQSGTDVTKASEIAQEVKKVRKVHNE
ncbi:MAG: BON domain-containing protein, partial [Spongiibacteraceae bacterium]